MDIISFESGIAICHIQKQTRDDPDQEFPVESLVPYLNCIVKVSADTTLRHVWDYLSRDADFFGKVFKQAMGNFDIEQYVKQSQHPSVRDDDEDPNNRMYFLEVSWDAEIDDGQLYIFGCFDGVGKHTWTDVDGKEHIDECGYAIEFNPINDLLDYPLRINEECKIRHDDQILWEGTRTWTVYDLYHAILHEITFLGTPSDQMRAISEQDQIIAEAKDYISRKYDNDD